MSPCRPLQKGKQRRVDPAALRHRKSAACNPTDIGRTDKAPDRDAFAQYLERQNLVHAAAPQFTAHIVWRCPVGIVNVRHVRARNCQADNSTIAGCCRIAEPINVAPPSRHCNVPHLVLSHRSMKGAINSINGEQCRAVTNAPRRDITEKRERVPVSAKQHLMRLQWVGAPQNVPAERQLDLRPDAHAARNLKVLTQVELEGIAGIKMQWQQGLVPDRLLFALPIFAPPSRKGCHPGKRTDDAKPNKIGTQLPHSAPFFARLSGFGLQPAHQFPGKRIKHAVPYRRPRFWLNGVRSQMLGRSIPRHPPSAAQSRRSITSVTNACVK
jgi:hypothetical protein